MSILYSVVRKDCLVGFDNILNQVKGIFQIGVFVERNSCLVYVELLWVRTICWIHLWVHGVEVNVEIIEGTAAVSCAVEEHIDTWVGSIQSPRSFYIECFV